MDIKEIIQVIVSFVGIGSFLFGVFQYRQAQRWKRLEFAANQLQKLYSEPDLALAAAFLDFSKRTVALPEKYRELAGTRVFQHDCQTMYRVMETHYEDLPEFFIYVEVFERLFGYLAQIDAFIRMKLIEPGDVNALRWILTDLAQPQWSADNRIFIGRISLDFPDVLHLMDVFSIDHADKMTKEQVTKLYQQHQEEDE